MKFIAGVALAFNLCVFFQLQAQTSNEKIQNLSKVKTDFITNQNSFLKAQSITT